MAERALRRLRETYAAIQPVPLNDTAYERLWRCYQRAFLADRDLLAATGALDGQTRPINGVTEPLDIADIEKALCMPETLGLELRPDKLSECLGFVIIRYATRDPDSRRAFRKYLFDDALCGQEPRFDGIRSKYALDNALDVGNIMCSVEFVANGNAIVAAALLIATYKSVAIDRMKTENAFVIGKCLDRVCVGPSTNDQGNIGIKALAEGVNMRKICWIDQSRPLGNHSVAKLRFRLYLGDCKRVRANALQWGIAVAPCEGNARYNADMPVSVCAPEA
jgi:hypothetical protein